MPKRSAKLGFLICATITVELFLELSHGHLNAHTNMTYDFYMCKVHIKLVLKVIDGRRKRQWSERVQMEPDILENVITVEETWAFECDPDINPQVAE